MDDSERERWQRGLRAAEAEELAALEPIADAQRDRLLADALLARIPAKPRPKRAYQRRGFWAVAAAAALAASLGLWLLPRGPAEPPLPRFALSLRGDDTLMAAAPASSQARLSADSRLHVNLQPAHKVSGKLTVTTYLRSGSGPLIRWPLAFEQQPSGALSLSQRLAELPWLAAGDWDVVFVLSSPEAAPSEAEVLRELAAATPEASRRWQLVHGRLLVNR